MGEIKNRIGKKELELKKKEKVDDQQARARFQAANARRLERYEKWSQDEVKRNHERLAKLKKHTSGGFKMAKKLFKRKKNTKVTAIESMAKSKAARKQQLRMGGYLQLKGDQINFRTLVALNDKLATAMDQPAEENIKFAQQALDEAAAAVSNEKAKTVEKEKGWKAADKKEQERKEKEEAKIHREKLDKL